MMMMDDDDEVIKMRRVKWSARRDLVEGLFATKANLFIGKWQ